MPRPWHRPDRLLLHVASEQLAHVSHREDVRVGDDGLAVEPHGLRWVEAQRSETLQVVRIPVADVPCAQDRLACLHQPWVLARIEDSDVEAVGLSGIALVAERGDARAEHLSRVRLDENTLCHAGSICQRAPSVRNGSIWDNGDDDSPGTFVACRC
jgi:hypothetical protein